jgi:hypothetical protein
MKPCTLGKRHKWVWQKNVTLQQVFNASSGQHVRLYMKGLYRCECKQLKYGEPCIYYEGTPPVGPASGSV